jgi:TolB-like protein/Tfp pilus assembly protein PilF
VTRSGVPKLLDFGIATLLDPQDGTLTADNSLFAQAMTLRYASPEQIRNQPITAASDVYSLGVLLYELLTGSPPYPLEGIGRQEAERVVSEQIPQVPSAAIAAGGGAAASRRRLIGDLDAIVMTALRKDPSRRYATAHALADDLERHLTGQPVAARGERLAFRVRDYMRRRRRAARWVAVALAVLAVVTAATLARYRASPAAGPPLKSIAVLPLTSTEPTADLEYLSDGLTENIIHRLSRLAQIRVIARDSVFSYKGKSIDALEVGRHLGVETILAGRIAQRDGGLVVSVELIDTRDRRQLWSHQYRRHSSDVQTLVAELAQQIADALRLRLSPAERTQFARAGNLDTEAYHLYLKGRYSLNKRTVNDLRRSIDYLSQAVAKQPDLAAAHAGLADAYGLLTEYHGELPRDTYEAARTAAARALELDGALAEAHTSVAYVKQFYEWDWTGAEAAFRRALALNPGYATAHQWYAELLSSMGRHDEALAAIRRATENDPVSLIVNSVEAHLLYLARRYDEAIEQCRKVIDLDPDFPEVYVYLKRSLDEKGLFEEAVEARQIRRRLVGLDSRRSVALEIAASTTDRRLYWQKRLEQELAESRTEGVLSFDMAEILAQAGNRAAALDWLEKACADGDFMTATIRVIPTLDPLRAEPRFLALLERGCPVGRAVTGATSGQR